MIDATDWGDPSTWFVVDNSYDQPRTPQTVPTNIAMETQAIDNTGTLDGWGGWFQTVANSAFQYALAKDAAGTKDELSRPPARQYGTAAQGPGQPRDNTILLIALAGGSGLVLNK